MMMDWTINFKPYFKLMRLHRPIGIWLLMFPSWWGLALASPNGPPLFLLLLFTCGALFMRSAGCVYNDMIDQDFDRHVRRTASRPIAAGEVSTREAFVLLLLLLGASATLLFYLPLSVFFTSSFALSLVLFYPWMKRLTYWPQIFLGVTMNMGLLMGWLCLHSSLSVVPFLFYGGAVLWTLGYDTIYAFQDRDDDLLVGVKSSALVVTHAPKIFLSAIYSMTVILWGIGGSVASLGPLYWPWLGFVALHFTWQIVTLKEQDPNNCMKRFQSNKDIGILLFLGIVFSHLID